MKFCDLVIFESEPDRDQYCYDNEIENKTREEAKVKIINGINIKNACRFDGILNKNDQYKPGKYTANDKSGYRSPWFILIAAEIIDHYDSRDGQQAE